MQVCVIWAYKPNQVETIWTTLAFMKPFSLLYCSALLSKQSHMRTHTHTLIVTRTEVSRTHTRVQTLCWHSLPMGYNEWYLHSSLDKRVVPLARWIVAKWMGIYHKAKAACEKWGTPLFRSSCFHSFSLTPCDFAYARSSWAWPPLLCHACALGPSSSSRWKKKKKSSSIIAALHRTSGTSSSSYLPHP